MIKFLHAADLHLDAPFSALSREHAVQRRQEQRAAVAALVQACNEAQCDLMLLAGDLLDSAAAYPETVACLVEQFAACRAEIFISPGNHDRFVPGCPYDAAVFSDNVHIFTKNQMEAVTLPSLGCTVWGAAFTAMDCPPLLAGFHAPADGLQLAVLHGEVRQGSGYNAISEADIAASGLAYLALGHVHTTAGLLRAGHTAYAWSGCPMGRGFDETGEKGYFLGTVDENGVTARFVPLPGRKYEWLTVEAGDDPAAAIEAALPPETVQDIYRIDLTGEADPIDLPALETRFAPRFFGLSLRDKTLPRRELWAAQGEDTLRGRFLRALKARYNAAPDEAARREIADAARYGLAAMEGRETI